MKVGGEVAQKSFHFTSKKAPLRTGYSRGGGSEWEMKERAAEPLQQKDRGNPGVTASLLPQPALRSVGGGGMQGWRDESRSEGEEREGEFRDRLIYEFLFLNRDVFRDFAEMSQSGAPTYTHRRHTRHMRLVIRLAKSSK